MAKKQRDQADTSPVEARVLTRHHHEGDWHDADSIITGPANVIAALESQGLVDSDSDAVAYAKSLK